MGLHIIITLAVYPLILNGFELQESMNLVASECEMALIRGVVFTFVTPGVS
jgi:hypothetical protein